MDVGPLLVAGYLKYMNTNSMHEHRSQNVSPEPFPSKRHQKTANNVTISKCHTKPKLLFLISFSNKMSTTICVKDSE